MIRARRLRRVCVQDDAAGVAVKSGTIPTPARLRERLQMIAKFPNDTIQACELNYLIVLLRKVVV